MKALALGAMADNFLLRLFSCLVVAALVLFYNHIVELNDALQMANQTIEQAAMTIESINSGESAATIARGKYDDGTYTGTAQGYGGPITVQVTIVNGYISTLEIVSAEYEDAPYYNASIDLLNDVMATQGPDVDAVAGSTVTSDGIINALKEAFSGALLGMDA
jgi:uncharacterized protein with FMN-binding domain